MAEVPVEVWDDMRVEAGGTVTYLNISVEEREHIFYFPEEIILE